MFEALQASAETVHTWKCINSLSVINRGRKRSGKGIANAAFSRAVQGVDYN
jgi:hypothetical protein